MIPDDVATLREENARLRADLARLLSAVIPLLARLCADNPDLAALLAAQFAAFKPR
jgi:hypothetical protein